MPSLPPQELIDAVLHAIQEFGYSGVLISPYRQQPRRFSLVSPESSETILTVYIWTLTFGGRPQLANEYRIQMTSVTSPLDIPGDGPALLLGYDPALDLFAGFDLNRHRTFTTGSPSVQIDIEAVKRAQNEGLSFHRKSNDEIAVGIRPDQLINYALNAESLHRYGREGNLLRLLGKAVSQRQVTPEEIRTLSADRRRVIQAVSRLSRLGSFRLQVLFAYGSRCAVTRVQLRLVDAAHILPVGAPDSSDDVRNGIALAPTYHGAFDNGLIYLDDEFRMQLNTQAIGKLERQSLNGGLDAFRAPLGTIFLPPDKRQ